MEMPWVIEVLVGMPMVTGAVGMTMPMTMPMAMAMAVVVRV